LAEREHVRRFAIVAIGSRQKAVIGRVMHGAEEHAVNAQQARRISPPDSALNSPPPDPQAENLRKLLAPMKQRAGVRRGGCSALRARIDGAIQSFN